MSTGALSVINRVCMIVHNRVVLLDNLGGTAEDYEAFVPLLGTGAFFIAIAARIFIQGGRKNVSGMRRNLRTG